MRPKVLAYYFPDFHLDPRNATWYGEHWDEWSLVKNATARFPGHEQPRVPALGYLDELDPVAFAGQIDLAVEHGVDGFIFDYYWYEDGPYLEGALQRGFLGATNSGEMEFSVMWANHDLLDIFPSPHPDVAPPTLKSGLVSPDAFRALTKHLIDHYFWRQNYTKIEGRPRFSIYEIGNFILGMGGIEEARVALEEMNREVTAAGYPGVHLDAVIWGFSVLPSEVGVSDPSSILSELRFDSASSYVWLHHIDAGIESFPQASSWASVGDRAFEAYERYAADLPVPFHPNVSVGWDPSPRTSQDRPFVSGTYPWMTTWAVSPADFERGLRMAERFSENHPLSYREITINAWNEWTEGSYLLPDVQNGLAFLEAIRRVFGARADSASHSPAETQNVYE